MSSDVQDNRSVDQIGHEMIHAICRENAHLRQNIEDLKNEVQLWQQALFDKAQENTQLASDLLHSQKEAVDSQASVNDMHFQLRQQAIMMTSLQEQTAETIRLKERELQKRRQVKEQLEIVRHLNAQLMEFVEVLNSMDREDLGNLIDDKVDFDGILASHPTIARHVEKTKQENTAKDEILKEYKGTHQHLCGMLRRLLNYHIGEHRDRV